MNAKALSRALLATLVLGTILGNLLPFQEWAHASRNSSGTYSLPTGNPVVTGTTISSTWANNTFADVKTEITNSLDRGGRGGMTAPLQCTNGTVAAPSITFGTDTDTGLYRIGANNPGMAAGGILAQQWTATGTTMPLGATVTQSATDTPGLSATGNGAGQGLLGTGGAGGAGVVGIGNGGSAGVSGSGVSGPGLLGNGGGAGDGVIATGGTTGSGGNFTGGTQAGAKGVTASGGSGGGVGGAFTGTGTSAGLTSQGGTNASGIVGAANGSGSGGKFTGGAGGVGVEAIATGGAGMSATSSGSTGGSFTGTDGIVTSGTSGVGIDATGTTVGGSFTGGTGAAISIGTGNAKFTSSNPATTTAFSKTLTPKNIIKSWGKFSIGSGSATVNDGFNLTSCSVVSTHVECTMASAMTSTSYAVFTGIYQVGSTGCFWAASASSATVIRLDGYKWTGTAFAVADASADSLAGSFQVVGSQ